MIKVISGGQTGVDRAALDTALQHNLEIGGWCPKGGWAEDLQIPPGLLAIYKQLTETPSKDTKQRTEWNVRDSDATLILLGKTGFSVSPGTEETLHLCVAQNKPVLSINVNKKVEEVISWLDIHREIYTLNIAGPRESECSGLYQKSCVFFNKLFKALSK